MSNLQELMTEIKKAKATIEAGPGSNPQARRVKLGRISQAKSSLENLYMEYRKVVRESAIFILATGEKADEFAETANKEYQCFGVEADKFYQELLDKVPEKVYLKQVGSRSFFEHLSARLEDRARDIDVINYPPLAFGMEYKRMIKTKEDALQMTKNAMNELVGSEIVALDAIEKVSIQSVNSDFQGKVIPIVLYTKDEDLAEQLLEGLNRLTRNVFIVNSGKNSKKALKDMAINDIKNVTKESVEKTLVKIKENVL